MSWQDIAKDYSAGRIKGWGGPELAAEAFNLFGSSLKPFKISNQTRATAGRKMMLYQACRKVLGKDTPNYPQEAGSCVAFGGKNATEHISCVEIAVKGDREKWRPIYPPYYYSTSRILVGGGRIPPNQDGSLGLWLAQAVVKYGALFADENDIPPYSGDIDRQWGARAPENKFLERGKKHIIHSAAQINSWDELVAAIVNGYACTTASMVGYENEPGRDGFHRRGPQWAHQMCFIGVNDDASTPYAIILNSWGEDAHGRLKDFDTGEDLPGGVLRVRRQDAEAHIRAGETFAWSNFDGFPEQDLDEALFKIFGS